jgi:hypothetical protein
MVAEVELEAAIEVWGKANQTRLIEEAGLITM